MKEPVSDIRIPYKLMERVHTFEGHHKELRLEYSRVHSLRDHYTPNIKHPCSDKAGVYFLFDTDGYLAYVGSSVDCLGRRFAGHFEYGDAGRTFGVHKTFKDIGYYAAIGFLDDFCYEAAALELYLILQLSPRYNEKMKNSNKQPVKVRLDLPTPPTQG